MKNYFKNKNIEEDYVIYEIRHNYQDQSKMLLYLYIFPIKEEETQKYLDYLNSGSSSKFICICGITFYVYRLSNTGSLIVGMEKYIKNQNIYSCLSGDHMCVLECIYIAVYKEEYKKLNRLAKNIIPKLKQFYRELFDKPFRRSRYYENIGTCC
jgi:hypothetical protein